MKRTPALLLPAALLLAVGLSPVVADGAAGSAAARTEVHRVYGVPNGHDDVGVITQNCDGVSAATGTWTTRYSSTSYPSGFGPHALGFTPSGTGSMRGVYAFTSSPQAVDTFTASMSHSYSTVTGHATAVFYPDTGKDAVWIGQAIFTDGVTGWHRSTNFATSTYSWRHFVAGKPDGTTAPNSTLAVFTAAHATSKDGMRLALQFGCDGQTTYVDDLTIGSSSGRTDSYNLDAARSSLSIDAAHRQTCQVSALRFPARVKVHGRTSAGPVKLARYIGRHGGPLGTVGKAGKFSKVVKAKKSAYYTAYHPATATTESSYDKVYVPVFPKITMGGVRHATRGGHLTVRGTITPHLPLAYNVLLSRWTGHSWTPFKRVAKSRANRHGQYSFRAPTGQTGRFRVNLYTFQSRNISSTINRSALVYTVTKPRQHAPAPSPVSTTPSTPTQNPPPSAPPPPPPPSNRGLVPASRQAAPRATTPAKPRTGFGPCGWTPTKAKAPRAAVTGRAVTPARPASAGPRRDG